MTSVESAGPAFEARGESLASKALTAQLDVLQIFLPMEGWLVCRRQEQVWLPIALRGRSRFDAAQLIELASRPLEADDAVQFDIFLCKALTEAQCRQVFGDVCNAGCRPHLIQAMLKAADGCHMGYLTGLSRHLPFLPIAQRETHIHACLSAMGLTVALQAELGVAGQLFEVMQRSAYVDPLTGVLNRAGWGRRMAQIEAGVISHPGVAIVMLDLDDLKVVNDSQGHAAGDALLRLAAQTIASVLRGTDAVGRLGGDEFGVVIQNVSLDVAASFVSRLQQALDQVDVQISMGLAHSAEAGNLRRVTELADERMYENKRSKPGLSTHQRAKLTNHGESHRGSTRTVR